MSWTCHCARLATRSWHACHWHLFAGGGPHQPWGPNQLYIPAWLFSVSCQHACDCCKNANALVGQAQRSGRPSWLCAQSLLCHCQESAVPRLRICFLLLLKARIGFCILNLLTVTIEISRVLLGNAAVDWQLIACRLCMWGTGSPPAATTTRLETAAPFFGLRAPRRRTFSSIYCWTTSTQFGRPPTSSDQPVKQIAQPLRYGP